MLARKIHLDIQGECGGFPPEAEDFFFVKIKRNEGFSFKVRFFFYFFAGLPRSPKL